MSSDPNRRRRLSSARIARAMIAAVCAVSLSLTPLVAPSTGLAKPPASSAGPPPVRALEPPLPQPDPSGGGARKPPCRSKACQALIKRLCARINCNRLSELFRSTRKGSSFARRALKREGDAAFEKPVNGKGFDVHHIVPQGGKLSRFAQSILQRAGVKVDDPENLAALRGASRQVGKPGYRALGRGALGRALRRRMADSDTYFDHYNEQVNERFTEFVRSHQGRLPNRAEVQKILQEIKSELYRGGGRYLKPGPKPRRVAHPGP